MPWMRSTACAIRKEMSLRRNLERRIIDKKINNPIDEPQKNTSNIKGLSKNKKTTPSKEDYWFIGIIATVIFFVLICIISLMVQSC